MKSLMTLTFLTIVILLSTSCASTTRDVASEKKECKQARVMDHESYYENYEDCHNI